MVEEARQGKSRVKKFLEKPRKFVFLHLVIEYQWSDDEPFNPIYTKIDRIIDEGELNGQIHYLVKWCGQTYDLSTWETDELVENVDSFIYY